MKTNLPTTLALKGYAGAFVHRGIDFVVLAESIQDLEDIAHWLVPDLKIDRAKFRPAILTGDVTRSDAQEL